MLKSNFKLKLSNELITHAGHQLRGILSLKSKHILTLQPEERRGGEFHNLLTELDDMEFFQKFSNDTKEELAKKMMYITKSAKSILVKQGEPPLAVYVIISGVVSLRYNIPSMTSETKKLAFWPEKILKKGDYFGHEDLIHKRCSSLDIQCIGYSELLLIREENFILVQSVLQTENIILGQYIRSSEVLKRFEWSEEEYKVLEVFSELDCYLEEQEIYSGSYEKKTHWSYFVVCGECKIVRELLPDFQETAMKQQELKESSLGIDCISQNNKKALEFEKVRQGFYFGVGEDLGENFVFATAGVECLKVPRLLLVFKNKKLLDKMATDLSDSLPSDREILDNFSEYQHATKEVEKVFQEIFKDKPWRLSGVEKRDKKPAFIKYV